MISIRLVKFFESETDFLAEFLQKHHFSDFLYGGLEMMAVQFFFDSCHLLFYSFPQMDIHGFQRLDIPVDPRIVQMLPPFNLFEDEIRRHGRAGFSIERKSPEVA